MPLHLIGRNTVNGVEVLCRTDDPAAETYWRSMEVSHALGHPTAVKCDSQVAAWRVADMQGGIAVDMDWYARRIPAARVMLTVKEGDALVVGAAFPRPTLKVVPV